VRYSLVNRNDELVADLLRDKGTFLAQCEHLLNAGSPKVKLHAFSVLVSLVLGFPSPQSDDGPDAAIKKKLFVTLDDQQHTNCFKYVQHLVTEHEESQQEDADEEKAEQAVATERSTFLCGFFSFPQS